MPQTAAGRRRRRLRDRLGAQGARHARGRGEHRRHRPGVPALGHAAGLVRRRRHHHAGGLRRQEDRQLGLRQRVRGLRRRSPRRGSTRPRTSRSCSRTSTCPVCSTGDIDAAEAMTYNEYAQVLEAVNPDTGELYQPEDFNVDLVRGGRRRHAPGRDLGRRRTARVRRRLPGHRGPVRHGLAAGLGVLPRQRRGLPRHRGRAGLEARRQPPAVADERDQQADLAGGRTASASSTRPRGTAPPRSRRTRRTSKGRRC